MFCDSPKLCVEFLLKVYMQSFVAAVHFVSFLNPLTPPDGSVLIHLQPFDSISIYTFDYIALLTVTQYILIYCIES